MWHSNFFLHVEERNWRNFSMLCQLSSFLVSVSGIRMGYWPIHSRTAWSLLDWEAQNWAWGCGCSITSAEGRASITPHHLLAVVFLMQSKMCWASYSANVYWWLMFSLMSARPPDLFLQTTVCNSACTVAWDCSGLFYIPIVWLHQVPVGPYPQLLWALWMAIHPSSMWITPSNCMWSRASRGTFSPAAGVTSKVKQYQF